MHENQKLQDDPTKETGMRKGWPEEGVWAVRTSIEVYEAGQQVVESRVRRRRARSSRS